MSLDSVELLVSFENYFQVSIPDPEAERIRTVQDMTDCICRLRGITATDTRLRDDVFALLAKAMRESGISDKPVSLSDQVHHFFDYTPETWKVLEKEMKLVVPPFPVDREDTWLGRMIIRMAAKADYRTLHFSDFCDVICAANYTAFAGPEHYRSSYEVYIALMALTAEKTGVDLYEVKPGKSFTDDFGID